MGTFSSTFYPVCLSYHDRLCRLIFPDYPDVNVNERAGVISQGIPDAIAIQADQAPGGSQSAFQNPNKFLGYTEQIYVCYPSPLLG